jgi:protein-S-isoprenylcysteine O-methyltransferase Ste14
VTLKQASPISPLQSAVPYNVGAPRAGAAEAGPMSYSTPMLLGMGILMLAIALLVGLEPWMVALGAAIAIVMFLVERRGR